MEHRYRPPPRRPPEEPHTGAGNERIRGRERERHEDEWGFAGAHGGPYAAGGRPPYAPEYYSGPDQPQEAGDEPPPRGSSYQYRSARSPDPGMDQPPGRRASEYGWGEHSAGYGRDQEYGDFMEHGAPRHAHTPSHPASPYSDPHSAHYRGMGISGGYEGYRGTEEPAHRREEGRPHGGVHQVQEPGGPSRPRHAKPRRMPKGYVRSDERIREDICERLIREDDLDVGDISIEVQDGSVRLEGWVAERRMKHRIEDVSCDCLGVRDVDNRIRVGTAPGTATQHPADVPDAPLNERDGED